MLYLLTYEKGKKESFWGKCGLWRRRWKEQRISLPGGIPCCCLHLVWPEGAKEDLYMRWLEKKLRRAKEGDFLTQWGYPLSCRGEERLDFFVESCGGAIQKMQEEGAMGHGLLVLEEGETGWLTQEWVEGLAEHFSSVMLLGRNRKKLEELALRGMEQTGIAMTVGEEGRIPPQADCAILPVSCWQGKKEPFCFVWGGGETTAVEDFCYDPPLALPQGMEQWRVWQWLWQMGKIEKKPALTGLKQEGREMGWKQLGKGKFGGTP